MHPALHAGSAHLMRQPTSDRLSPVSVALLHLHNHAKVQVKSTRSTRECLPHSLEEWALHHAHKAISHARQTRQPTQTKPYIGTYLCSTLHHYNGWWGPEAAVPLQLILRQTGPTPTLEAGPAGFQSPLGHAGAHRRLTSSPPMSVPSNTAPHCASQQKHFGIQGRTGACVLATNEHVLNYCAL